MVGITIKVGVQTVAAAEDANTFLVLVAVGIGLVFAVEVVVKFVVKFVVREGARVNVIAFRRGKGGRDEEAHV